MKAIALATLMMMAPATAFAHTPLTGSVPESGAILEASPQTLSLTFAAPVRLTQLKDVNGTSAKRLSFSPTDKSASFTATAPALPAGRNEIQWKALSEDGHVMEGVILIIVRPKS